MPGVTENRRSVEVLELDRGYADDLEASRVAQPGGTTRQKLGYAVQPGVEVEKDTAGRLIPVFHDIYRAWAERWIPRSGLPPVLARRSALRQEPLQKFETVAAGMGDACRVFVAWHRGRPVAAAITLVFGEHAIGWRSYSITELAAPVSANVLTQVAGLEDACRSGCRWFDLGQSGGFDSLHHYTSSLSASPRSVVDLRIEPAGLARLRAVRERAEGVLVRALTRSPDGSTLGQPSPSLSRPGSSLEPFRRKRGRAGRRRAYAVGRTVPAAQGPDASSRSAAASSALPATVSDSPRPRSSVYLCPSVPARPGRSGPAPIAQ